MNLRNIAIIAHVDHGKTTLVDRLLQQAGSLLCLIEHYGQDDAPNFSDIRQRAAWLLSALRHHQAQEADLIFETFYTGIGTGD